MFLRVGQNISGGAIKPTSPHPLDTALNVLFSFQFFVCTEHEFHEQTIFDDIYLV